MGTIVSIELLSGSSQISCDEAIERAFGWFQRIEACCSRFDAQSELVQLAAEAGRPIAVSSMLFEIVRFARAVAEASGGAFDPTVGRAMEQRGFDREYRSGKLAHTPVIAGTDVSYLDVHVDEERRTITLQQPLLLDLGGVAKGFAVDMAAKELSEFRDFAINAGGDLYLSGSNAEHQPWSVGIRHPRHEDALIECLRVTDCAVCTSGDYERQGPEGHHILDPRTGESARAAASVTVVAPSAMLADGLATAVFVLGPLKGLELLQRLGVNGLIYTPTLTRYATPGLVKW